MTPKRRLGWVLLAGIALTQIYALYLYVPAPGLGGTYADKVVHFLLFGVPAAVAASMRLRWVLIALLIHAVLSEPLQALLPATRSADALDLVADLLGIVVGMGLGRGVVARWARVVREAPTTPNDLGVR